MGAKGWSVAVLSAVGVVWLCGLTERERPVVGDAVHSGRIGALEQRTASTPEDPAAVRALGQAYLDARQSGLAIGVVERAAPAVRRDATVEHLYARALLDQGRSADALAAERRALARCADPSPATPACAPLLVASATRRADILEQLVQLGVEDANAQPEASRVAYHNAARPVSLSLQ